MRQPLGCDAVAMPAEFGPRLLERLPRVGCVYEDGPRWWWIVPADSDVALQWPPSAFYSPGAVVPDATREPVLVHRPEGSVPYPPPSPLYLGLGRLSADREVVVMMACGISPYRLLQPVLVFSVVCWGLTSWVMLKAMPDGNQRFRELTQEIVIAANGQVSLVRIERPIRAAGRWSACSSTAAR